MSITFKTPDEIQKMRVAGRLAAEVLDYITPFVKAGKLRMLAVTTAQRLPDYPQVPTMAEALGAPDFEASSWFAMYAPAGTPAPVSERLNREIRAAVGHPAMQERLLALGLQPVTSTPQELADFSRTELAKWPRLTCRFSLI